MGMLSCNERFSQEIFNIVGRLQSTEYAQIARTTLEEALKFGDHSEVLRVFRNLQKQLQASQTTLVKEVSCNLHDLLEQESARMTEISRKILFKKGRKNEPEFHQSTKSSPEDTTTFSLESLSKELTEIIHLNNQTHTPASDKKPLEENLGLMPLDIIQEIVEKLPTEKKALIFNTLLESKELHATQVRKAILLNALHDVPTVDHELAQLYQSTFGKPLAITEKIIEGRKIQHEKELSERGLQVEAEPFTLVEKLKCCFSPISSLKHFLSQQKTDKNTKSDSLDDHRSYTTMQRLRNLPKEFDALPINIRHFFTQPDGRLIQSSEILKDNELCKQVVKAIRAHNLVCLGAAAFGSDTPLPSLESLLKAGDDITERLKSEGSLIQSLQIRCPKITHIPVEISYLKNLTTLHCIGCISLITLPPEIGNISKLLMIDCSHCPSLHSLPHEIGKLKNIQILNITNCFGLRVSIEQAERFKKLQRFSCCRSSLPPEVRSSTYPRGWNIVWD